MKANEAIRDALQELGQQAAEQPVSPPDIATGILYLNRMMRGVDYLGLGYSIVDSGSDTITVPAFAEEWVVFKLASRLAGQYPKMTPEDTFSLNEKIREAWDNMYAQLDLMGGAELPSTLPMGSGNNSSNRFYPESADNILNESGNNIVVE